ncbi:MAG: RNB domain-containing ribonuclease, partial [Gemmatimonadaceae bacterium]
MTTAPVNLRQAAAAVMVENGFEPIFSPEVMREVATLDGPSAAALPKDVRDMRALPWTSIDNRESRDLDQVEVARRNPDGSIRVSIGVA